MWTTEETFADHIPTFQGRKQITETSLLRPAEVQFSDRIVVEYLDNRELIPLELKTSPKQTVTTRPKHEDNHPETSTPLTSRLDCGLQKAVEAQGSQPMEGHLVSHSQKITLPRCECPQSRLEWDLSSLQAMSPC